MEPDFAYFSRRAKEEREAAMKAPHPGARQAHIEMADRYNEFASAIAAHHEKLSREPVSAV